MPNRTRSQPRAPHQPASALGPRHRSHSRITPMQPLAPSSSRSPASLCTSPRRSPVSIQTIAIATHLRSPDETFRPKILHSYRPSDVETHRTRARLQSFYTLEPRIMPVHVPVLRTRAWAACHSIRYSTVLYSTHVDRMPFIHYRTLIPTDTA